MQFADGVNPADLDPAFLATVEAFASRLRRHRYAGVLGLEVLVTSGYREGDPRAHGHRGAVDLRGRFLPWDDPQALLKYVAWLAGMWGETVGRISGGEMWEPGQWAFAIYPDDHHIHIDVRPHAPDVPAAVWIGR